MAPALSRPPRRGDIHVSIDRRQALVNIDPRREDCPFRRPGEVLQRLNGSPDCRVKPRPREVCDDAIRQTQLNPARRAQGGVGRGCASGAFGATRSAFADDTLAEIKKRGVLSTATEMQFPPFDISDNGTYKGLNRDLIDAVGKQMGLKVSYLDSAVDQRAARA